MSLRSLYERRLRREESGKEVFLNRDGNPRMVVSGGTVVGVRAVDGSVIPLPEQRPEDLPDDAWVHVAGLPPPWRP